jgi:hypothetical protein
MNLLQRVVLLLTLLLSACGSSGANLQFLNASANGPSLDVLSDGDVFLFNIGSLQFAQYSEIDSGTSLLTLNEAGTSRTLAEVQATLNKDQDYTLIAIGGSANLQALLLSDNNAVDQASTAKLRFVNASPSAGNLDFYLTVAGADIAAVNPVLSDLAFGEASDYLIVGAATYQVRATLAGTKTIVIDSGNFVLSQSQVRTGVAVDKSGGGLPPSIIFMPDQL